MKTLINNSATGLMIGSAIVIILCGFLQFNTEVLAGGLLLIGSSIIKALTS